MRNVRRPMATAALVGSLLMGTAACGGSNDQTENTSNAQSAATPVATIDHLTGVKTEVILADSFTAGLKKLKVAPGVVGTATLDQGTVAFPITGGNVTYYTPGTHDPYVTGKIEHNGSGISLSAGKIKVELTNFVIDPGSSMLSGDVSANGKSVLKNAPLFILDGSTLQPLKTDQQAGTGVLYGTKVELTDAAAKLLDKTFNTDALTEKFLIGTARITVKLPS